MTFADRSEGAMTELIDKVASALVEGYDKMDKFTQYNVKDHLLPVLATCIDVLDAEPHKAKRGDEVEAWIRRAREAGPLGPYWAALDDLLDDYRLHADVGAPLSEEVVDGGGDQFDGR